MPRKQLEVPPAAARSFMKDLCAFFAEKNTIKADEIAARQAWGAEPASRAARQAPEASRGQEDVRADEGPMP
jgi:hypothetical protein